MNKTIGEKVMLLWQQKNHKGGARKVYLQMHWTIYGSVQAARAFWVELNKAFQAMGYTRCDADPCLYVRWDEDGELCMWLTWINDCIVIGKEDVVARESAKLMSLFDCDDLGPMEEYIGNKIEITGQKMKLTQPVLMQSFTDEFGVKAIDTPILPAKPGEVLVKGDCKDMLMPTKQTKYRSGVGKLRYLATWSRLDILNAVREISRHMKEPNQVHIVVEKLSQRSCGMETENLSLL
jgi:Reverse transcriptase (RNA-dependent DNA polymerase)